MTETTQPDPQVVAWMRRHLRDNPGASRVDLMRGYRNTDSSVSLRELNDAAEAVLYPQPATVADIPAGQGPASLFLRPNIHGGFTVWFKTATGLLVNIHERRDYGSDLPNLAAGEAALWDHLTATLPTVTAEEGQ